MVGARAQLLAHMHRHIEHVLNWLTKLILPYFCHHFLPSFYSLVNKCVKKAKTTIKLSRGQAQQWDIVRMNRFVWPKPFKVSYHYLQLHNFCPLGNFATSVIRYSHVSVTTIHTMFYVNMHHSFCDIASLPVWCLCLQFSFYV